MPICPSCGAASPATAATCANCGRPVAPGPAIGEVEDGTVAPQAGSPWGAGRIHRGRELPTLSRGWLTAGRVLIAPTLLLVVAAVLGSATAGGDADALTVLALKGGTEGFQNWLGLTLTAFGAPWQTTSTLGDTLSTTVGLHVVPYLITALWSALLWGGLRLAARARAAEPTARAAGAQALRTGALSAALALALGLLATHSTSQSYRTGRAATVETGPALLPLGVSAALAAAVLVLAVDGAGALRAEAGRRPWLGALCTAWRHAARVLGALLVLLTLVAAAVNAVTDRAFRLTGMTSLLVNDGVQLYGVGSGARLLVPHVFGEGGESFALYDLNGNGALWWLAAVPVALAAPALGWSAHRARLTQLERACLAALYAALTAAPVLGTSVRLGADTPRGSDRADSHLDLLGWSLTSVLIASAAWAVFGALLVPAVLDAVRRTPVPLTAPSPTAPPLPEQAAQEPVGLVELVVEEQRPAAAPADGPDAHAAYRRPGS